MAEKVMTLQSATGISSPIMIECRDDVVHFMTWSTAESTRAWANPKRADVLEALGAVDKVDVIAAESAADELQAKLAEAEATVERLRKQQEHTDKLVTEVAHDLDGLGRHETARRLVRALEPPKPFELPTEVPARIEARDANGAHHLVLWTDGENLLWHSSVDGDDYSPEEVIERFTDHRLLDGDS